MDIDILKEFGLTKNEIDIFLILIKKNSLSATEIAKHTGLNRPYIYYALERLLEKGYISEIRVKGKKNYQAIQLDRLYTSEETKLEVLKELIKELENVKKREKEEIYVEVFKGKYATKNVFKDMISRIKPKEEILYIGIDEEKMEVLEPIYIKKILNHLETNKINERVIIKKAGKRLEYAKTTKYKEIDPKLIGNTAKIIYQDIVVEIIYGEPMYTILIRNKELAETSRKQFELFWSIAR